MDPLCSGGCGPVGKVGDMRRAFFWAWMVFTVPWALLWLGFFLLFPPPDPGWSVRLALNSAGVLIVPLLALFVFGYVLLWVFSLVRRRA